MGACSAALQSKQNIGVFQLALLAFVVLITLLQESNEDVSDPLHLSPPSIFGGSYEQLDEHLAEWDVFTFTMSHAVVRREAEL